MKVGLWLIGARGSLGTTVTVGLALLRSDHAGVPTAGLVSELSDFADVELPAFADLVVGGHDLSGNSMLERAESLGNAGVFPHFMLPMIEDDLKAADARVRPGVHDNLGLSAVAQVQADMKAFREENDLERVIVVNVSSTEHVSETHPAHASLDALDKALDDGVLMLPASAIYAYAALDAGFAFVDFTPSMGASIPALDELAIRRGAVYAGRDGKTGETLVKTALTPMFLSRNLKVTSWAGLNLLGGGDGRSLAEPERKAAKLASKARSLTDSLGYEVDAPVHIEYVEDMNEWKTAWNQVRFQGFLGTQMTMQITWQGCDSALAAPLVIDLVRFTALAGRKGEAGALDALGFFFKDPLNSASGTTEHRLGHQFHRLVDWANALQQR